MLKLASHRLAYPQYTMGMDVKLRVLSCDPTMPPNARLLQSLATPDTTLTPVKIDVLDMDFSGKSSSNTGNNPNIESSIIIYNCGITSFLYAQTNPLGSTNYQALLLNAFKFFNLSAQVSSSMPQPDDDEVTAACHLVLAFLALRGLLQVVQYDGRDKAELDCNVDYYVRLHDDIYTELRLWQSGTTLLLLLMDPQVAAMA